MNDADTPATNTLLFVIVAEQVTARFLNVIGLLAGSIPIIAIQLNVLRLGDQIILNFVKVLDQRQLRTEEPERAENGEDVDRSTWDEKVGPAIMKMCDRVAEIANEKANPKLVLKYKKSHVALCVQGNFFNVLAFFPRTNFVLIRFEVSDTDAWKTRLGNAGIDAELKKHGTRVLIRLRNGDIDQHEKLLRELIHEAVIEEVET